MVVSTGGMISGTLILVGLASGDGAGPPWSEGSVSAGLAVDDGISERDSGVGVQTTSTINIPRNTRSLGRQNRQSGRKLCIPY